MRSTKPTPTWWSTATTTTTSALPPKPRKAPLIRLVAFVNLLSAPAGRGLPPFLPPNPTRKRGKPRRFGGWKSPLTPTGNTKRENVGEGERVDLSGGPLPHKKKK